MRRLILAAFLLTPIAAQAQPAQLGQQIDSAIATVTRVATGLGNQIAQDQEKIAALQQMVAQLTKELDDLKAKPGDAPKQ